MVNHLQQQITAAETTAIPRPNCCTICTGKHPAQAGFMLLNHLDKGNGQEYRHRIIATGFNLQRGPPRVRSALCRREQQKTAAASVEPTIAPISIPSIRSRWNSHAAIIPVRQEVISTPTVASEEGGPERDAKRARLRAAAAVQQDHRQRQGYSPCRRKGSCQRDAADYRRRPAYRWQENNQNRDAKA